MATAPVLDTSATETSEKLPWKVVQCPHEWDVTRPEIYVEDRWHPIFKEMREQAPINKVEGSGFGSFWNATTLKAIQHVEALPDSLHDHPFGDDSNGLRCGKWSADSVGLNH